MSYGNGGGFFTRMKSNVVKWWQQVVMPVLVIRYDSNRTSVSTESVPQTDGTVEVPAVPDKPLEQEPFSTGEAEERDSNFAFASQKAEQIKREKELARQQEIERLRRQQQEQEQIAAIMNANKVNVNAFIEAGREAKKHDEEERKAAQEEENLRKAQEIIDRLNREAAEDEAKKEAEIAEAKAQMGF